MGIFKENEKFFKKSACNVFLVAYSYVFQRERGPIGKRNSGAKLSRNA